VNNIGLAEMVRSSLTTVNVPKHGMVAYAMLILLLEEQFKDQQPASIVLPTMLIVRESCETNLKSSNLN
jgi:DNA-binding LacI/PurR family transcriptional regulator